MFNKIDNETGIWVSIIFPLVTASFYLFVYPYAAKFVYKINYRHKIDIRDARNEIEKATLLTKEESEAILENRNREHEAQIAELINKNTIIASLREEIKALNITIGENGKNLIAKEQEIEDYIARFNEIIVKFEIPNADIDGFITKLLSERKSMGGEAVVISEVGDSVLNEQLTKNDDFIGVLKQQINKYGVTAIEYVVYRKIYDDLRVMNLQHKFVLLEDNTRYDLRQITSEEARLYDYLEMHGLLDKSRITSFVLNYAGSRCRNMCKKLIDGIV